MYQNKKLHTNTHGRPQVFPYDEPSKLILSFTTQQMNEHTKPNKKFYHFWFTINFK